MPGRSGRRGDETAGRRAALGALAMLACAVACAEAPVVHPRVVAIHPHDPAAFTQGLALSDGVLFESTGLYGRSSVRRVDLRTGRPTLSRPLPARLFGEGLAVARGQVYQLTWRAGRAFVRDRETLETLRTFTYDGEGWGLAFDGRHLVMSDGSDVLRLRDPGTFAVVREVAVHDGGEAVSALNELEHVDGVVYANVWRTTRIARIDLRTGEVLDWIELDALVPPAARGARPGVANGIAHDPASGRLLVTGKLWPRLYEVEVPPPP